MYEHYTCAEKSWKDTKFLKIWRGREKKVFLGNIITQNYAYGGIHQNALCFSFQTQSLRIEAGVYNKHSKKKHF